MSINKLRYHAVMDLNHGNISKCISCQNIISSEIENMLYRRRRRGNMVSLSTSLFGSKSVDKNGFGGRMCTPPFLIPVPW